MATWEGIKDSLFAAGRDVSQKAKEVSEIAKLKMDIRTKEDFVEKQFAILGRAYFEANKENASEKDSEQFVVIQEALDEIERMTQQVLEIQGMVQCSNCGKKVPEGTSFCSDCGTKIEVPVEEEPVVDIAPEDVVEEVVEEAVAEEAVPEDVPTEE